MFEQANLRGTPERRIILQTREGKFVENSQAPNPSPRDVELFGVIHKTHPDWKIRKPACGIYNCFGHVWAVRRTGIYSESEIQKILDDDGYRQLGEGELPSYGDIALYYTSDSDPTLWHAGMVTEFLYLENENHDRLPIPPIPWVLSKLSGVYGEVLHKARDVHSPDGPDSIKLAYFTDRPVGATK